MSWYAIEAVDDALTATRRFLFPVELGTWLRLAIVAFFVGGGATTPPGGFTSTFSDSGRFPGIDPGMGPGTFVPSDQFLWILAAIVIAAVVLGLVFALISATMQFVLVDAVVAREISVRRFFRRRFGKGLRLFGFHVGVGLLIAAIVAALVGPVVLAGGGPALWLLLLAVPVFFLLALVVGVVFQLTIDFVVPVMIAREVGVLDAWRTLWPTLREQLGQTAIYVVVRWVLSLAAAILVGIVTSVIGLVVGIVVFLPIGLATFAAGGPGMVTLAILAAVGTVLLAGFLALMAIVQAPIQTYLRYFSLLVLAELNPDFDLLGEFGREVREDAENA